MNWEQVEGHWKQFKGKLQQKWGELSDDDLDDVDGRREQLEGLLEERYGIEKKEAKAWVDEFLDEFGQRPSAGGQRPGA